MATNALAPQNENALAAFGLFPHINKYRQFNDPISSANMPVQGVLGLTAATPGTLSELLSMFQSPTGNELTGDVNYEQNTKLPYGTQELSKMLPLQPMTPNERFARGLGEMVPINPAPALRAVGKVGEMALRGAGEMANARMLSGESMVPGLSSVLAPSMMKFAGAPGKARAAAESPAAVDKDIEFLQKALLEKLQMRAVGLGEFPSTMPQKIKNQTAKGGYTVNLPSGVVPNNGLMMGRYANNDPRNMVIPAANLTKEDILQFAKTNKNALNNPENHLGTWKNPDDNNVYLDVSKRFEPDQIRQATKFGEKTGQIAGYNTGLGESYPVGNWGNFIKSDEFVGPNGRLAQMEKAGRDYLSNFPTANWWDIRGSNMEKVYGKENLPQVAGFTAATAPVSAPRENIQTMSEYMRRHIKGEPILQPDWRVGEGMMTRTPGVQIGMEGSRANNLVRSGLGDYANLSGKKVGEEGRALMGDPNAVVLDRHQIRVSEDPSRGIYASGTADIITPDQYDALKNAIVTYTKNHSTKTPNEASADIWTGIRETIKNKSDLFGTKFQGSAVTGDSKSYIDHFNDLIKDKAKHLGISLSEMETRLKKGDANLLSTLLATPLGLEAWQAFQERDVQ